MKQNFNYGIHRDEKILFWSSDRPLGDSGMATKQNLKNLVLTVPGEKIMNPNLVSRLNYSFRQNCIYYIEVEPCKSV